MPWVVLLAIVVAANGWLLGGCLVPYVTEGEPEYLLLLPPLRSLAVWFVVCFAILLGVRFVASRRGVAIATTPLLLLVLPLVSVALLATPLRGAAGPLLYLSVDLYWWLVAAVVVLMMVSRGPLSLPQRPRYGFDVALVGVLAATSLVASPRLRFQSVLVGDEPKYLRYLENWYRGRGMDVANLGPIATAPPEGGSNVFGNVDGMGRAVATVAADVARDARRVAGLSAPPRPGPASSRGGWFVDGKRGGVYQVHNPGISLLLFPGYLVDRAVSQTQLWHPQFPTNLYGTGTTVLVLYLLWGVATSRLLTAHGVHTALSWTVTAALFLSLPVSAFAYQYYPEVAAGLVIALLMRYTIVADGRTRLAPAWHGVLAGFLPWLHLRFMILTLGGAAVVAATRRRDRAALVWFGAGLALPLAALAIYDYHVTGNPMPWALYALIPDEAIFSVSRAWHDFPAVWFDRTWGLIAHAPIYLLALPGLPLMWKKNRRAAVVIGFSVLAIAIPAAGHGYTGAFTTPSRLIAAVLPLLAIPIADAAVAYGSHRAFIAVSVLLGVVSVQNGVAYNIDLIKSEASLHAATIGGWLFPLLLPDFQTPNRFTQPLAVLWLAIAVGLIALPMVWRSQRATNRPWTLVSAATLVAFAAAGLLVGGLTGSRWRSDFILNAGDARDRVIHFALTGNPSVEWSSTRGVIDVRSYFPNPEGTTGRFSVQPAQPAAGTAVALDIAVRRPGNRPGWGVALVDFGDGSPRAHVAIEGVARASHTFRQPGEYDVAVEFQLWGLDPWSQTQRVRVSAP